MPESLAPAAGVSQNQPSPVRPRTGPRLGRRTGRIPAGAGPRDRRDFRATAWGYLFVLPALLVFGVWTIFPTFYTFYISLWHWNEFDISLSKYVGLANYRQLFQQGDPSFLDAFGHSLYFTVGMVLGGTAIALGFALLVQRGGRLLALSRLGFYLPHATPLIASSLVWGMIFDPRFGLLNYGLDKLHLPTSQWLYSPGSSMPAVIVYSLWHEVGFITLVFIGGLAVISDEYGEAARVDGCGPWREFWYITWPQLRPVTTFVVLITTIGSLQAFTQFYELRGAGNSTVTLSLLIFLNADGQSPTLGYAAAAATVLFAITVLFSLVRRRTSVGGGAVAS
ncbi:sugar ABC transporter permease [Actinospica durhamensis]|uniref:Sugar ABC transporter permease n=1 Tax=Actinospica durhamensis TaxID=1508375 RepID=A0A941ENI7_9ACTN|nr:sugar ABC transporter permease [Actinospica durhamensis]MBR7833643.1 sugar ABC transporter permease [Actinospica durhamensis]